MGVFDECQSLSNIQIPPSVSFIGQRCLRGCKSLTEIEILESVTK